LTHARLKQLGIKIPSHHQSHGFASKNLSSWRIRGRQGVTLPAVKLSIYDILPENDPQAPSQGLRSGVSKNFKVEASTFGVKPMTIPLIVEAIRIARRPTRFGQVWKYRKMVGVSGFSHFTDDHNVLTFGIRNGPGIQGDWVLAR
jgi:branched-chain amino acid transport system substrate-binding protein